MRVLTMPFRPARAPGLAAVLALTLGMAACGEGAGGFVHDDPPFAVEPPPDATALGPGRTDDPMYSVAARWNLGDDRRTITVAVFDEPQDPDWIMDWGGQHDPLTIGQDIAAQGIVTVMEGVYERHVFVTHEPSARVVELSLAIGGVERWLERPLHEIEAEYDTEIDAFETMLASFRWRD